jgi:hypothetical protein
MRRNAVLSRCWPRGSVARCLLARLCGRGVCRKHITARAGPGRAHHACCFPLGTSGGCSRSLSRSRLGWWPAPSNDAPHAQTHARRATTLRVMQRVSMRMAVWSALVRRAHQRCAVIPAQRWYPLRYGHLLRARARLHRRRTLSKCVLRTLHRGGDGMRCQQRLPRWPDLLRGGKRTSRSGG